MSKKSLTTFEFPKEIQREYHLLTKSKDSFTKKLSDAEFHKLETLYAQLNDAWSQNHTGKLMRQLDQKYQELREIQKAIESDFSEYRKKSMTKYTTDLEQKERNLELKRAKFSKEKTEFFSYLKKCSNDIKENENFWRQKRDTLSLELQQNLKDQESKESLLANVKETLKEKSNQKNLLLQQSKLLSHNLKSIQEQHQRNINDLKKELDEILQKERMMKNQQSSELKKEEEPFLKDLKSYEESLQKDLISYETNLLTELRKEILAEIQSCPDELKNYFLLGDYSSITLKRTALINETEKLGKALNRELTKVGISSDKFFSAFDANSTTNR